MKTARRFADLPASQTVAIAGRAAELRRQGHDIVSFAAGEPDFDTPPHVVEAMVAAARRGATRYPPLLGLPELRAAAARHAERRYRVPVVADDVVVTPGAKYALWATLQALVDPGDEVLVPTPCWVSYAPQIALAGGTMVAVQTHPEAGFRLTAEAVRRAITPRTVGLVLNLPNNPTGALAARSELHAVADLALEHDLWILSDDIYAELRYEPGDFPSPLLDRPELRERVIIVDGPSKSHAMTGWRLGWAIAPRPLVAKLGTLLGQTVTGVTTFAQHGAVAALEGDDAFLAEWIATYRRRRDLVVTRANAMGLPCARAEGAFYELLDVRSLIGPEPGRPPDDIALATLLLESRHVAFVPGSAFRAPGFLRLSFACSESELERGLERMADFAAAQRSGCH